MKSSLPLLSALALAVIAAAAIAQREQEGARWDGPFGALPTGSERGADDAAGAYTSEPSPAKSQRDAEVSRLPVGDRLLRQAIRKLDERDSITVRLRHQVALDGSQHYGVGSYWQLGKGDDLETRLELQIAGQEASLLQTSNGRDLWIDRRLPTGRSVTRIELHKLRADLTADGSDGTAADAWREDSQASAAARAPDFLLMAASGGLRGLLASLGENFTFLPPQAMRLSVSPPLVPQSTDLPVYAIVGHWKPQRLAALVDAAGQAADARKQLESGLAAVPERFPQEVLLLFDQSDLFPYRVEYRRLETPRPGQAAAATIFQLSASPLVVLELTDVRFNAPIAAGLFDYTPPNALWTYQTAVVRERLRGQRQQKLAERQRAAEQSPEFK
jgi:hypothetical protein